MYLTISVCSSLGSELLKTKNMYFTFVALDPSTMSNTRKDIIREQSHSLRVRCSGTELYEAESKQVKFQTLHLYCVGLN